MKHMEKHETDDLETKIKKLRAEGKSYREIAKEANASISTIHRILKPPAISTTDEDRLKADSAELDGELASRLFKLFRSSKSLIDVVIEEKLPPETVVKYYQRWGELNYSLVDSRLSPLWHLFHLYESLDRLTNILLGSSSDHRVPFEYVEHKNRIRDLLPQIIIATSKISMKDAHNMLRITQKDRKWSSIEEFYPETDTGYIEVLEKIWQYHRNG